MFVEDQSEVKKGEILAIIENSVNYNDLILLKNELVAFKIDSLKENELFYQAGKCYAFSRFLLLYNFLYTSCRLRKFANVRYTIPI